MTRRVEGIDVARGVAALTMILGHAFDAWVSPAGKATWGYALKRFAGTFPLPTFLLLAGVSVAWAVASAARRGARAADLRRRVVRRGIELVATGYAVNVAYGVIDGQVTVAGALRVDVLHVIGLSIALFAGIGVRPPRGAAADAPPDPARLDRAALAGGAALALACPLLTRWAAGVEGPARHALAPLVEVAGTGGMPLVPLGAWLAGGIVLGRVLLEARAGLARVPPAGAPTSTLLRIAAGGAALAVAGHLATGALLAVQPGTFDRAHAPIWTNLVDLGGRAVTLVALASLLANRLPDPLRRVLLTFGRHSLTAYVFHVPFAYGRPAAALRGRLDVPTALVGVAVLWAASWVAIGAWRRLRGLRWRPPARLRSPPPQG